MGPDMGLASGLNPLLFLKAAYRGLHLLRRKPAALRRIPGVNTRNHIVGMMRTLLRHDPVHRREQPKPIRRLKSFNETADTLKARPAFGMAVEEVRGFLNRAGNQPQRLVRSVATVGITGNQIAFNSTQDVVQIFGIGP
ncbi:hypothetical protein [Chloracidobacterium thermophilum]|uniref:hypothetical protein n=1 Tax=Chloracidobacterium thermophilum TaxID=458033 RepID=UPI001BB2DEF6|nr:hypothetical protein [Chloracidobacterium thermophilum]QUV80462.1 hypothetical protein J8C08_12730 [Chloracidobacterium thermophilum]